LVSVFIFAGFRDECLLSICTRLRMRHRDLYIGRLLCMFDNDTFTYAFCLSLNVKASFIRLIQFILDFSCTFRFMLFVNSFVLFVFKKMPRHLKYIQSLNRVCSVWSYIESGYVYQYLELPTYSEELKTELWSVFVNSRHEICLKLCSCF
jgi:hypothetical protein